MKALLLERQAPAETAPLRKAERPTPEPGPGELLLRVLACGVCRTDLHLAEGDLPLHLAPVVPGHQAVGRVESAGPGASGFAVGELVGAAWLHAACGACRYCARGDENLCASPLFTGWDVDGGCAQFMKVRADFAYRLPAGLTPEAAAPLLCAGIIGYRALRRSAVPRGGRLAIFGFGGSAHVAIQVARHWGCEVHAFTRSPAHRRLALELGAASAAALPEDGSRFDAAVLFAPSGALVPVALEALDKGGTLAVAGIHLSPIPSLDYRRHLFDEKRLVSVTANTREDGRRFLRLAAEIPIKTTVRLYEFERANEALADLKADRVTGAAVLLVGA
ncbi:MAG: zinc-dependent alcohol dehydrogenase family protein [Elusimicrobia bacterium]|nr:zinc-dependent alcohol dehydrogenase family protein [Elusimicrobiota bacterium]